MKDRFIIIFILNMFVFDMYYIGAYTLLAYAVDKFIDYLD